MFTITPFDESETASEITLRVEHGRLTANEFRQGVAIYVEMAIAALRVANPDIFIDGEDEDVVTNCTGANVRHDVELTDADVRHGDYSAYVSINRLQRLISEGVTHLDVTYTVTTRSWNREDSAIVFKASIPVSEFAGQDSITITVMDENRGGRLIQRPNYETKWGRFFTEVK